MKTPAETIRESLARSRKKPQSYPFLWIAVVYGVDYGDVLAVAQAIKSGDGAAILRATDKLNEWLSLADRNDCYTAVLNAIGEFADIQAGHIDWLTGEPRAEETREFGYDTSLLEPLKTPLLDAETLKPIPGTGGVDLGEPVTNYEKCADCNGTGWLGHGMGGDTCGKCAGLGRIYIAHEVGPEPGEHAEIIHALDYRNHDNE